MAGRKSPHTMKYYIVQAYSGFENKVKASLQERIRNNAMDQYCGDTAPQMMTD